MKLEYFACSLILCSPLLYGEDTKKLTDKEIESTKKGAKFYVDRLAALPKRDASEWMRRIDQIELGMRLDKVWKVLPYGTISDSTLWAYDGMDFKHDRQYMVWAIDSAHAVMVAIDEDMVIVTKPILLRHTNKISDYGILDRDNCRIY